MIAKLTAITITAVTLAAPAHADPSLESLKVYAAAIAPSVCLTISRHGQDGIIATAAAIEGETGWSEFQAGEVIGIAVWAYCPQLGPVLKEFAGQGNPIGKGEVLA
jgi:hypothetical protein